MESLALIASIIVLGRIAYVALCVALVVTLLDYHFADGFLQARPGLPPSPWFALGMGFVALGLAMHGAMFWKR